MGRGLCISGEPVFPYNTGRWTMAYREYPKPIPVKLLVPHRGLIVGEALGVRETVNALRKNSTFDFKVKHSEGTEFFWQKWVIPETR